MTASGDDLRLGTAAIVMAAFASAAGMLPAPADAADVTLACTSESAASTSAPFAVRIATQPEAVRAEVCADPQSFLCSAADRYLTAFVATTAGEAARDTLPDYVTDDTVVVHGGGDTLEPLMFNGRSGADVLAVFEAGGGLFGYWRLDVTVGAPGAAVIDSGSCTLTARSE